jgi:hypothetical protein
MAGLPLYHRLENPYTQTRADASKQKGSGQLWGSSGNFGAYPCVRAYLGPLKPNDHGIEFTTTIPHDSRYSTPSEAQWYYPQTPKVQINPQGFAWIPITVTRIA